MVVGFVVVVVVYVESISGLSIQTGEIVSLWVLSVNRQVSTYIHGRELLILLTVVVVVGFVVVVWRALICF